MDSYDPGTIVVLLYPFYFWEILGLWDLLERVPPITIYVSALIFLLRFFKHNVVCNLPSKNGFWFSVPHLGQNCRWITFEDLDSSRCCHRFKCRNALFDYRFKSYILASMMQTYIIPKSDEKKKKINVFRK